MTTANMTLEQLVEMSGGESIQLRKPQAEGAAPKGDPFTPNTAFAIEITEAKHVVSKNGYDQLELAVSIVKSDGSLQRAGRIWETLPVLSEQVQANVGEEKAANLRNIFGRNLLNLLRAVAPETFSVYATKQGEGKSAVFLDADGNKLTSAQRNKKEKALEAAVIGAAKAIQAGQLELTGKRLYLVKKAADNGKVYTNYSSEPFTKFPAASI